MGDIFCVVCGEPYESYYVAHDMTVQDRERFLSGKWCECCKGVKPEGRTETQQLRDMGHNIFSSEDPDAVLENLGL